MDFFGIGLGEVLLIVIIALIIFGPGRLPEIARTIGRMTHSLRKATSDFTTSLTKEINTAEKDQSSPPKAASPPAIVPQERQAGQDEADKPSAQSPTTAADESTGIEKQPQRDE
jgi:sec-independent protein translocase protein TatA